MLPEENAQVIKEWLQKSAQDLLAGEHLLKQKPILTEPVCFFTQQAIEKALKAFLIWKGIRPKKTHDLRELSSHVLQFDLSFRPLLHQVESLSRFAVTIRYPGEDDPPTIREARGNLKLARKVYREVLKRLPNEIHS
ncbi:MAG: HEPN domain-containing protein [Deltaproteobacteria bacterium]|nr:HEPN domain-containing protein [Deltaproteobacteria bacterium]